MAIVAGFDEHQRRITFDVLDTESGEVSRGWIDATPVAVAAWVRCFVGREVYVAVEAWTGWLFVANALAAAGVVGASVRADVRTWPSSGPPQTARERLV